MRKFWVVLSLFAVLSLPSISWSRTVSIVLKTGDVVKGKLLGSGEKGLIIQSATGKARTYPYSTVEEVFDADTNANLSGEYLKKNATAVKTRGSSGFPMGDLVFYPHLEPPSPLVPLP